MRIESGVRHRPNPDAIGLVFIAAGKVDLLLCCGSLGDHHAGLRGIAVA